MKKILFELITSPLTISDNYFIDFIIMSIISLVAYKIAFKVVGDIGVCGEVGSVFHWIIRSIIFIMLWFVYSVAICIISFIINHKAIVSCSIACVLLIYIIINFIWSRKKNKLVEE